ncbi:MAG: glycoside hydrolase family 2 TIM barrel-domain containing protein [Pseudothermotoga sp.]
MHRINLDKSWQYLEGPLSLGSMRTSCGWKEVDLPHDIAIEKERDKNSPSGFSEGYTKGFSLFYRKELSLDEQWSDRNLILEFEGIMGIAEVFVNERLLKKHFNGYTSFLVDITKHVRSKEKNNILVHVQNELKPNSRWYSGTGIYRHVWLHIGGKVYIKPWHIHVTTKAIEKKTAAIEVKVVVINSSDEDINRKLILRIFSAEGELVLAEERDFEIGKRQEKQITTILELSPFKYWSLEDPYLYKIQVDILKDGEVDDSAVTTFGIRTISVSAKEGFKLNGRSIKLRGGCVHHDHGPLGSASYDRAEERKVELLKACGFNALRLAHNPFSPSFLDACDKLGMLVIEEFFDVWTAGKLNFDYHLFFDKHWEEDIESAVKRDYNHPSVVMWSIGNEVTWGIGIDVKDEESCSSIYSWSKRLSQKVREIDPTRPITAALCAIPDEVVSRTSIEDENIVVSMIPPQEPNPVKDIWGEVSEKFFESLDIAGYNYKVGRYAHDAMKFPNRVICGTETYPYTMLRSWKETIRNSNVVGDFVWTAFDYLGEAGLGRYCLSESEIKSFGGDFPWFLANCGDIDICGEKRPQSYYRDIVWGNRKDPYIAVLPPGLYGKKIYIRPWGWEPVERSYTFPGCKGMPIRVFIYADADEIELFVNGRSLGKKQVKTETLKVVYDLSYEPGILEAVAYKNGKQIGKDELHTTGEPVAIKLLADRKTISAENDLCYVKIVAVDENEREVSYADNRITVHVDGVGKLIALGTADPLSTEPFTGCQRKLYKGKALAIVKSIGLRGEFILKTGADRLQTAQITVICE